MNVLNSGKRKIRKVQVCYGCGRNFKPGEFLDFVTTADSGTINTVYWCDVCQDVIHNMDYQDEEFYFMDVRKGDPEEWEESRKRIEGEND